MSTRTAGPIPAGSIRTPLTACALIALFAITAAAQVGPPPVPAENPITPEKTVLGKILFWDEQLSSDNTTSCGTCHQPRFGAGDARSVQTAGPDGIPGNDDDTFGSPGVIRSDASNRYIADLLFDFAPRVTPRLAPTVFMSAFSPELFWDGRAETAFRDPQTGQIVIGSGASLESLAVAPQVNDIEMAHEERDWDQIVAKLEAVIPMHLASNLPADVQTALGAGVTYPDLYSAAFGDPMIDAPRTAMAIATYLRTLVPEQTPFDAFVQGDGTALTPAQQAGLNLFNGQAFCFACHRPNDFSDHLFHNTGIRPASEDVGRMAVTNDPLDIGKFKTPTLRNVGLRPRLTHGGHFGSLEEIVEFYDRGGDFHEHQDPLIRPLGLTPLQKTQLVDFLRNGLTDPRRRPVPVRPSDALLGAHPREPACLRYGASGIGWLRPVDDRELAARHRESRLQDRRARGTRRRHGRPRGRDIDGAAGNDAPRRSGLHRHPTDAEDAATHALGKRRGRRPRDDPQRPAQPCEPRRSHVLCAVVHLRCGCIARPLRERCRRTHDLLIHDNRIGRGLVARDGSAAPQLFECTRTDGTSVARLIIPAPPPQPA